MEKPNSVDCRIDSATYFDLVHVQVSGIYHDALSFAVTKCTVPVRVLLSN